MLSEPLGIYPVVPGTPFAFLNLKDVMQAKTKEESRRWNMIIEAGKQVSIEYTLEIDNGIVMASNVGSKPYTYVQGAQQVVPGLEKALQGMKPGEEKAFAVSPQDGFGERSALAFQEVDKSLVPEEARKVDAELQGKDGQGRTFDARVADVKEDTILLDLNHPLAGKTLHFEVKVLNVSQADK
jgi:FKBP-type peptidyl-prolyl cis-trans isomerase SlyD